MVGDEIVILPLTFIMPNQDGVPSTINIHSNMVMESIEISDHVRHISLKNLKR